MPIDAVDLLRLAVLGFVAGSAGGMVGLGGAIVIIPILTLFLHCNQHLSQAAAMIVNVFVALPALIQHQRARAVRWDVVARILPFGLLFIIVGVEASDRVDAEILKKAFGVFLVYVVIVGLLRLSRARPQCQPPSPQVGMAPTGVVGSTTGFLAGLLGIGGGPVAVPLLTRVCRLPLRETIAASSAVICLTSVVGAARKNATLGQLTDAAGLSLGLTVSDSLWLAACLAPTAMIGALCGAGLTHRLPVQSVRVAFLVLVSWAGVQMLV